MVMPAVKDNQRWYIQSYAYARRLVLQEKRWWGWKNIGWRCLFAHQSPEVIAREILNGKDHSYVVSRVERERARDRARLNRDQPFGEIK